jgi:hypothetical protein
VEEATGAESSTTATGQMHPTGDGAAVLCNLPTKFQVLVYINISQFATDLCDLSLSHFFACFTLNNMQMTRLLMSIFSISSPMEYDTSSPNGLKIVGNKIHT